MSAVTQSCSALCRAFCNDFGETPESEGAVTGADEADGSDEECIPWHSLLDGKPLETFGRLEPLLDGLGEGWEFGGNDYGALEGEMTPSQLLMLVPGLKERVEKDFSRKG